MKIQVYEELFVSLLTCTLLWRDQGSGLHEPCLPLLLPSHMSLVTFFLGGGYIPMVKKN